MAEKAENSDWLRIKHLISLSISTALSLSLVYHLVQELNLIIYLQNSFHLNTHSMSKTHLVSIFTFVLVVVVIIWLCLFLVVVFHFLLLRESWFADDGRKGWKFRLIENKTSYLTFHFNCTFIISNPRSAERELMFPASRYLWKACFPQTRFSLLAGLPMSFLKNGTQIRVPTFQKPLRSPFRWNPSVSVA